MVQELVRPAKLPRGAAPDSAWAFLDGKFVPIREAKISVMTHGFNYGTGVFEGIRAYWNAEEEQLYGLHLREHYSRLLRSGKIMRIRVPHTVDELIGITVDLLRNLFADEVIRGRNPDVDVITSGVPGCAITHLVRYGDAYELRALASVAHLPTQRRTHHRR